MIYDYQTNYVIKRLIYIISTSSTYDVFNNKTIQMIE